MINLGVENIEKNNGYKQEGILEKVKWKQRRKKLWEGEKGL